MKNLKSLEQVAMVPYMARWLLLSSILGTLAGTASAVFLYALDRATDIRLDNPWLLWLLPLAGFAMGWVYHRVGQSVEGGNNLLIDEVHDPKKIVPKRMAPLVLIATVVTHPCPCRPRLRRRVCRCGEYADRIDHHGHRAVRFGHRRLCSARVRCGLSGALTAKAFITCALSSFPAKGPLSRVKSVTGLRETP
ncbi:hypothetical protein C7401_12246 [Paraburkholderia unamae]|nr:hypothetical protein C7401_12246 [Paraburkholderia unamae]